MENLTAEQVQTVRSYLEGMLVTIKDNYDNQKRIIDGKLNWLKQFDEPPLFLVDSKGTVMVVPQ